MSADKKTGLRPHRSPDTSINNKSASDRQMMKFAHPIEARTLRVVFNRIIGIK